MFPLKFQGVPIGPVLLLFLKGAILLRMPTQSELNGSTKLSGEVSAVKLLHDWSNSLINMAEVEEFITLGNWKDCRQKG